MRDAITAMCGENNEITRAVLKKLQQPAKRILGLQTDFDHLDSQLATDLGWRCVPIQQAPLLKGVPNMGKAIVLVGIFGFGNMDEVEFASYRQRDSQCVDKSFDTAVREIGWMNDGLEMVRHMWLSNNHVAAWGANANRPFPVLDNKLAPVGDPSPDRSGV